MYGVPKKGEIEEIKEYQNSHFSAPVIWNALVKEYFNVESWFDLRLENYQPLWKLVDDKRLKSFEKILLACTFDYTIIKKENFNKLCKAIDDWINKYPIEKERFHFLAIKEDLKQLDYKDYIGVCFNWTSVCDIWSTDRETEEGEECNWDIAKDKGHWFLFEDKNFNK